MVDEGNGDKAIGFWYELRRRAAFAFVCCALSACAGLPVPSTVKGRVVDDSTRPARGVAGVTLLFLFRGTEAVFPHSADVCDAAALGVTDDNGYFDWPTHIGRQTYVIAYKPGYVSLPALDSQDRRAVSVIKSPSRESTMANFDALVSAANCINVGADGEAIEEFFIPILAEAKSQARSSGNEKTIRRIEGVIWAYQRSSK